MLAVYFFVSQLQRPDNAGFTTKEKVQKLDFPGFALYLPMTVCLALGLQWAGVEYLWDSWRTILLFVLAAVFLVSFLGWEFKAGEDSMFPLSMLRQRSVALAYSYTFCNSAVMFVILYYLPIYFQAVRGTTTAESGLMTLPFAITFAVATLLAGRITTRLGYYTPIMVIGSILMAIAIGLFATFTPYTGKSEWIGYQILYGSGIGLAFQQPYTAVQTVLPESRVPIALVTLSFAQEFGSIVALSIAQNVFVDQLSSQLARNIPGFNTTDILGTGALGITKAVPPEHLDSVRLAYSSVIVDVFYIALALVCLDAIGAVGIEWKSVYEEKDEE